MTITNAPFFLIAIKKSANNISFISNNYSLEIASSDVGESLKKKVSGWYVKPQLRFFKISQVIF